MSENKLPWQCPDHPDATIKMEYEVTKYCWGGVPRGIGARRNYRFYCNECGRELAKDKKHCTAV